jgi:hypothetical protein
MPALNFKLCAFFQRILPEGLRNSTSPAGEIA